MVMKTSFDHTKEALQAPLTSVQTLLTSTRLRAHFQNRRGP
jgi:hypothetical protein